MQCIRLFSTVAWKNAIRNPEAFSALIKWFFHLQCVHSVRCTFFCADAHRAPSIYGIMEWREAQGTRICNVRRTQPTGDEANAVQQWRSRELFPLLMKINEPLCVLPERWRRDESSHWESSTTCASHLSHLYRIIEKSRIISQREKHMIGIEAAYFLNWNWHWH